MSDQEATQQQATQQGVAQQGVGDGAASSGQMPPAEIRTLQDYTRIRQDVVAILREIAATADDMAVTGASARLQESAARLEEGVFTLLVLGDFKTGKSSFLNALIQQDVLPTAVTPCTAVLATIHYSEDPYVTIHRFEGSSEIISLERFTTEFCLSSREDENERFQAIEQVELGLPADLCRHRVVIVDSPGLDESPQRSAITTSHIPRSDAAVFMMGADRLGREHELSYLRANILGQGLDNVFFVINRCDLIDEAFYPDQEREALKSRAWQLLVGGKPYAGEDLSQERIFFLSAKRAREAQQADDPDLLSQSGLPDLKRSLERFLAHDRGRVALQRPANLARETTEAVRRAADYRTHLMDVTLADLDDRIKQTEPDFERISQARGQAERVIRAQRDRCRADVTVRLRQKVAELQDGMRRVVSRFDFPGSDSFTGRVTASIQMKPVQVAVAEQLDRYLSKELAGWIREAEGVVSHYIDAMADQLGDNARQVHHSLAQIQLKIIGPQVGRKTAEQVRDPVERLMALQESIRQGEVATVLKETEGLWKGTARTLAAQFAGYMLLGMLGLATNPIAAITAMTSVAIGMTFYNTNLAIEQLRNGVADIARGQLKEIPDRTIPELERQVDAVFRKFTDAYLKAIDTLVGQEWSILKAIRDDKEQQTRATETQKAQIAGVLHRVEDARERLQKALSLFGN